MLQKYRISTNLQEIIKIIKSDENNNKNSSEVFFWQNEDGKRFIYKIVKLTVNERYLTFSAAIEDELPITFNQMAVTYCKLAYNQTVFKVSILNTVEQSITFNIPGDVRTLELRAAARQKFKPSERKHITISVGVELLPGAKQSLLFQVIDISETGVSLVVSEKNIKYFEDSIEFFITKLMDSELIPKIKAELVYFQKFKFRQKGRIVSAYRVGLSFSQALTINQLSYFF